MLVGRIPETKEWRIILNEVEAGALATFLDSQAKGHVPVTLAVKLSEALGWFDAR